MAIPGNGGFFEGVRDFFTTPSATRDSERGNILLELPDAMKSVLSNGSGTINIHGLPTEDGLAANTRLKELLDQEMPATEPARKEHKQNIINATVEWLSHIPNEQAKGIFEKLNIVFKHISAENRFMGLQGFLMDKAKLNVSTPRLVSYQHRLATIFKNTAVRESTTEVATTAIRDHSPEKVETEERPRAEIRVTAPPRESAESISSVRERVIPKPDKPAKDVTELKVDEWDVRKASFTRAVSTPLEAIEEGDEEEEVDSEPSTIVHEATIAEEGEEAREAEREASPALNQEIPVEVPRARVTEEALVKEGFATDNSKLWQTEVFKDIQQLSAEVQTDPSNNTVLGNFLDKIGVTGGKRRVLALSPEAKTKIAQGINRKLEQIEVDATTIQRMNALRDIQAYLRRAVR
jgi:hypothetical protein